MLGLYNAAPGCLACITPPLLVVPAVKPHVTLPLKSAPLPLISRVYTSAFTLSTLHGDAELKPYPILEYCVIAYKLADEALMVRIRRYCSPDARLPKIHTAL